MMHTTTIALPARDVARASAFYRELFGFNRSDARRLPIIFQSQLELEARRRSSAIAARLRLGELSRLERALEVAWERGGRVVECAKRVRRGVWSATILDSEGNLVSLYARA